MANEKQLIDANDVYSLFGKYGFARLHVADIDAIPRVDAVEVVRCEKCRKRHTWECAMHYESEDGKEQYGWENDNDFCSWGERKDGDGNG